MTSRPLNDVESEAFRLGRLVAAEQAPYFMHALFAATPVAAPGLARSPSMHPGGSTLIRTFWSASTAGRPSPSQPSFCMRSATCSAIMPLAPQRCRFHATIWPGTWQPTRKSTTT